MTIWDRIKNLQVAVSFLLLFNACSSESETLFTRLDSRETGIDFVNKNHETELSNILTYEYFYNGGGVAIGDINNDGLADIYFTSNIFKNKLYLNEGGLKFRDITEPSGTACEIGWKTGVTMADVNGDGLLDIYVCRSASPNPDRRKNILLLNKGDLTFEDRARELNLDDASYSTQAAFFDYDNDSDLDVVLLNHSLLDISNSFSITVKNSNVRFPDVGNKLYRNDNGNFIDVSDEMGVYGSAFNYGLGISLSDINGDGWTDLYLGCDYTGRDKLLLSDGGKFFRDVTHEQLSHISKFTMGTDIADINGDGMTDIVTLDMLPEDNFRQKQLMGVDPFDVHATMVGNGLHAQYMRNMLHLNNGDGTFSEIGQLAGISNTDWSWGALIQDYDNDGVRDIFVSNGFKRDLTNNDFAKFQVAGEISEARKAGRKTDVLDVIEKLAENEISNYAFKGVGDLTFTNATASWGLSEPFITNGIAYADLDNDGDLDLVTNNMNDEAGVYRNNAEKLKNYYLSVRLSGLKNTSGIGARVTTYAGEKKLMLEQFPVRGFQSTVDNALVFGLGSTSRIDSLIVRWPTGSLSVVKSPAVNTSIVVAEPGNGFKTKLLHVPAPVFSRIDTIDTELSENDFIDFNTQALLPRMYSRQGPALASGDVNSDGISDLYVGGPKGKPGKLFIGNKNGRYSISPQKVIDAAKEGEDIDAVFFDMDGDKDLDLYVVTGGYEFQRDDKWLSDVLYENDGKGAFKIKTLSSIEQSGSCVRTADVDGDSDIDLFIGGRIVPGRYPETPASFVLLNDGKGNFNEDNAYSKAVGKIGMVTDARWEDLNSDGRMDLIVVGEWMSVKILLNMAQGLVDKSAEFIRQPTEGFWNKILADDFDGDGDKDLVVGNLGLNNQMRASASQPVTLFFSDYDNNGSVDPIMDYFIKDRSYPYPTRDELLQQLPSFKKRFVNYTSYSKATIKEIFSESELNASKKFEAHELRTSYFENLGDHFEMRPLPIPFQFAPVFALTSLDVNQDGNMDIVAGGNLSATRARTGKLTASYGTIALGNGKGNFTVMPQTQSGLCIKGDVRHMIVDRGNLLVSVNNSCVLSYQLKVE